MRRKACGAASGEVVALDRVVRLDGHITPEQVRRSPFLYLPFQVPPHTRRVSISYSYSQPVTAPFGMGPGNTVDIGLFDSRGHDFLEAPGFRGWSGASKREFFIAPHEATPGYIRGPLFPGQWNIFLGFERVQPEGVRYDVSVTLEMTDDGAPEDGPAAAEARSRVAVGPKPDGRSRWGKGDLHCHSVHSDGLNSVEELVHNAVERGLDFLA